MTGYDQFQMTQAELSELISIASKPELVAAELSGKFWVRLGQRYKFVPLSATMATDLIDPTMFYAISTERKS